MGSLSFITSNPAISAFQEGSRHLQQQEQNELTLRAQRRKDAQEAALAASDLRRQQRENDAAVARADEFITTSPDRVTVSRGQAQMVPDNVRQNTLQTESAQVGLDSARDDLGEKRDRRPLRDAQASLAGQQAQRSEQQMQIDALKEVYGLIAEGQPDAAKRAARAYEIDLPDEEVANAAKAQQVRVFVDTAARLYPSSPQKQVEYLQKEMERMNAAGYDPSQAQRDPTRPYNVPGAPTPDAGIQGDRRLEKEVVVDLAIAAGYDRQTATDIALGRRPPTEVELRALASEQMAREMPSGGMSRITPEQRRQRVEEIYSELRALSVRPQAAASQPGAAPAAPAAASPATPPAGDRRPQGGGTQADPYQGASQEEINWFIKNAPRGAIIVIDGEEFTQE